MVRGMPGLQVPKQRLCSEAWQHGVVQVKTFSRQGCKE